MNFTRATHTHTAFLRARSLCSALCIGFCSNRRISFIQWNPRAHTRAQPNNGLICVCFSYYFVCVCLLCTFSISLRALTFVLAPRARQSLYHYHYYCYWRAHRMELVKRHKPHTNGLIKHPPKPWGLTPLLAKYSLASITFRQHEVGRFPNRQEAAKRCAGETVRVHRALCKRRATHTHWKNAKKESMSTSSTI